MIRTKKELAEYIAADAAASGRNSIRAAFLGDEIWKFTLSLRKLEYYKNQKGIKAFCTAPWRLFWKYRYHQLSVRLNYSIPINVIGKGLSIVHYGTIVISKEAKIGTNCRIHEGVTIGSTNGSRKAAVIGDNVFIGTGAKIIGDVEIADGVAIAANAVVIRSITEKGTTWGGIPARRISDHGSDANMRVLTKNEEAVK